MKCLIAGPYDYEFGHELFSFQGYVRKLAENYDKVIVVSKPGMGFIYEDFVDEFIPCSSNMRGSDFDGCDRITEEHCRNLVHATSGIFKKEQSFIKYGACSNWCSRRSYDVIIHARKKAAVMCPNLEDGIYNELYSLLKSKYSIAFVGTKELAYCPDGAEDLRGVPLNELAEIMKASRLAVGHSSGPIHFASLCGTPHLTWGGYRLRTFCRYIKHWNPFKTKCFMLEEEGLGYIGRRMRQMRISQNDINSPHVNIIETENYRKPTLEELVRAVEFSLDKLNGYS
jgi:hypothetical protein